MDAELENLPASPRPAAGIARSAFTVMLVRAGSRGLSFLVLVLLARQMGSVPFGDFVYVMSWLVLFEIPGTIGLPFAALRFGSEYRATREWRLLRGYIRWSTTTIIRASLLVALVVLIWTATLGSGISTALQRTFVIAALALPIVGLSTLASNLLRTADRVVLAEILIGSRPLILGTGVLAFWATSNSFTAPWAMTFHVLFVSFGLTVGWSLYRRSLSPEARSAPPEFERRLWLRTAVPMFGTATLNAAMARTDTVMVGSILTTEDAGIYRAGVGIAEMVAFGLHSAIIVIAPRLAGLNRTGAIDELKATVRSAARLSIAFTLPAVIGVLVLGRPVLNLFGEGFDSAYVPMLILSFGQLVTATTGPTNALLNMTGEERAVTATYVVWATINVTLNAVLIPLIGLEGAAIATAASLIGWKLTLVSISIRRLGINPTAFARL